MAKPDPGPGDRQPKETAPAFEAFRCYLELGPSRSTARVAQALGKSKTLADRWCSRWGWVERVKEYEGQAVKLKDEAHMDAIAKRSRRQAQIAELHGEATAIVGREVVQRVAEAAQRGENPLATMKMGELLQLEATLARAHARVVWTERLALGITTEQPGEPLPRSQAEEMARRMTDGDLDATLAPVDELAQRRAGAAKRKAASG